MSSNSCAGGGDKGGDAAGADDGGGSPRYGQNGHCRADHARALPQLPRPADPPYRTLQPGGHLLPQMSLLQDCAGLHRGAQMGGCRLIFNAPLQNPQSAIEAFLSFPAACAVLLALQSSAPSLFPLDHKDFGSCGQSIQAASHFPWEGHLNAGGGERCVIGARLDPARVPTRDSLDLQLVCRRILFLGGNRVKLTPMLGWCTAGAQ